MIRQFAGSNITSNPKLLKEVLDLDRLNMEPIMRASHYDSFPWEKRIAGLKADSTQFFGAYKDGRLVGYIDLRRDWNDPKDIYLSSIQIHPSHQGSFLFKALIAEAYEWLKDQDFAYLRSEVQIANDRMLKIFKQIGFEILDGKRPHTKLVRVKLQDIAGSRLFKKKSK